MKKLIKIIALILTLTMVFSFVACSNSEKKTSDTDGENNPPADDIPAGDNTDGEGKDDLSGTGGGSSTDKDPDADKDSDGEGGTQVTQKSILCQLKNSTVVNMMGYIFKTSDGKIIVIDGGETGDTSNLLETLKEMTGQEVPHIDAWILTHPHSDHINAFNNIIKNHFDKVTIDKIYCHFPSADFIYSDKVTNPATFNTFESIKSKIADKIVISQIGDKYTIGTARIDILFVFDPENAANVNDSSIIFKLTAEGKKMLFLGDAGIPEGNAFVKKYNGRISADYCQMAHHGQDGVNEETYRLINPSVCFWDAPDWLWENDNSKLDPSLPGGYNTGPYQTIVVRGWMEKLGVKTHYVEKDGNNYVDFATGLPMSE